jgi:iron complex outermembrane receptor protein
MRAVTFTLAGFALAVSVFGADDGMPAAVVEREDMVVAGQELHAGPVAGQDPVAASALAALPGVDLRVQGAPGVQGDLSIRGSSFSGAGLSLNGFALPNAQTEHFNTELPLPLGMLSRPVVYTGFDQALAGEGHLIGTVDFSLLPVETGRSLMLGLSEKEGYWGGALARQRLELAGGGAAGIGAFAGISEANAVDEPDNDLRLKRAGGQVQWADHDGGQWDLVFARQEKDFGARGYYGVTPLWAADEETGDTLLFSGWTKGDREGNRCRVSALYREQSDDYTLFWAMPGVYANRHRLESFGMSADGRWMAGEGGTLDWRITGSGQEIRSSSLGDHGRTQMGLSAVPGMVFGKWHLKAGARLEIFEEEAPNSFLPQVAAAYQFSDRLELKLAYSESVRQPSYTELNYESPASLGNAGLENQTAATTELLLEGRPLHGLTWKLGVFQQATRDTVDWVRTSEDSTRWEALNIGTVEAVGAEAGLAWRTEAGSRLAAQYTGMTKDEDTELYASRYALDYAEHLLQFSGYLALGSRLGAELVQHVRQQAGNALRGSSDTGYDASLALHAAVLKSPRVQVTLAVNNLWDDDFEVFPGQATVSPQRFSAGMTMDW